MLSGEWDINIRPFCSALMLPIVILSHIDNPLLGNKSRPFYCSTWEEFRSPSLLFNFEDALFIEASFLSCECCCTILFLLPPCTAINPFVLFPVHATPSTVFPKTSTIATIQPIITPTIIAVSNQVPYYYMYQILY